MNGDQLHLPPGAQVTRVPITDTRVIVPNTVELRAGGLDIGTSIAHLRIIDPLRQRAWWVPLNQAQVIALSDQASEVMHRQGTTDQPQES